MEEVITEQEMPSVEAPAAEEQQAVYEADFSAELAELREALKEAQIKAELLLNGASREYLSQAAELAQLLCNAGSTPEEAAKEIIAKYPHMRLEKREIPQFAAQTSGSGDGFSAVRRIFAKR
ncbi:MAG: hypothetical protein ACI4KM_11620 [Oscillospiraceae bacterium]